MIPIPIQLPVRPSVTTTTPMAASSSNSMPIPIASAKIPLGSNEFPAPSSPSHGQKSGTMVLCHIPHGMNPADAIAPGIRMQMIGSGYFNLQDWKIVINTNASQAPVPDPAPTTNGSISPVFIQYPPPVHSPPQPQAQLITPHLQPQPAPFVEFPPQPASSSMQPPNGYRRIHKYNPEARDFFPTSYCANYFYCPNPEQSFGGNVDGIQVNYNFSAVGGGFYHH